MKMQASITTPLPLTIVVEGRHDAKVLRGLLSESQLKEIRFFAAQGQMSVPSLARNILVFEGTFVLVVVDADGGEVPRVQNEITTLLAFIASPMQFSVFVFEPSLEAIIGNVGIEKNAALSEEQKRQLRLSPQIKSFLERLTQLQPSIQDEAEPGFAQSVGG